MGSSDNKFIADSCFCYLVEILSSSNDRLIRGISSSLARLHQSSLETSSNLTRGNLLQW
uniref:Uncharacterized protein n=1 Tax=Helianthus annuus TaxID=4232 RepID=A0A251SYD1_HELAN